MKIWYNTRGGADAQPIVQITKESQKGEWKMVYVCDKCRFAFERSGRVERCPDCGSMAIREAKEREKEEYLEQKREFAEHRKAQ